jgi:hypothetical protein
MDYIIHPLRGINEIQFGMHANDVRNLMNIPNKPFRRGNEEFPSDSFENSNIFCYYDQDGHLEAMEFASESQVFIGGVNPLNMPGSQAIDTISRLDSSAVIDSEGIVSRQLSLALWCPSIKDEPDQPAESILVGRSGYYDFLDALGS